MSVPATLSVLLDGVIDYAGLFPPAQLDMQPMVENYRRVMLDPRGWMVGRVIIPVSRLEEFEQSAGDLLPDEEEAEPWCLSAITRPCGDPGFQDDDNNGSCEPECGEQLPVFDPVLEQCTGCMSHADCAANDNLRACAPLDFGPFGVAKRSEFGPKIVSITGSHFGTFFIVF